MRHESRALECPATIVAGAAAVIRDMLGVAVQVVTDGADSTHVVEYSIDGAATWHVADTFVNVSGVVELPDAASHVRIDTTNASANAPTASWAGYNARTE
jgi:hypothetical protein